MRERRKLRTVLLLFIAVASTTLTLTVGFTRSWSPPTITAATATALILAGALASYGYEKYVRPTKFGQVPVVPEENPSLDDLLRRIARNSDPIDQEQLRCFAQLITDPKHSTGRIVEKIIPLKRVIHQRVSVSVFVPLADEAVGDYFLFPLMTIPKGEMQDGFQIRLEDDSSAPILNFIEYTYLIGRYIRLLAILSGLKSAGTPPTEGYEAIDTVVRESIRLVCRRGPFAPGDDAAVDECRKQILAARPLVDRPQYLEVMAKLVGALSSNYPLVAVVPRPPKGRNRLVVRYERYLIPKLKLITGRPLRRLIERVGMLLGSRPIELILGVDLAARTQSYHLLVYGPDGTYVGFQELLNATAFAGQFDANRRPYMRLRRRLGQSYAHAYFRNVAKGPDPANRMSYRVKFYETPPGSIAKAAVSSLTALLLIYIVAVIMSQSSTAPSSDFPALALAFPALVAAWIGFDGTSQRLFGGTLTSKVSSVFTVICSLGASALFMAQTSTLLQLKLSSFSILGVDQLYWLLILAIATTNAVWSTYAWLGFTTHYYLLARRDIGGPDSYGDIMPEATPA